MNEFPVLARHSKIFRLNFRKTKQTNVNASSKQGEDRVSVVCRKGSLLRQKSIYSSQFYELKVKWTKKLTFFFGRFTFTKH